MCADVPVSLTTGPFYLCPEVPISLWYNAVPWDAAERARRSSPPDGLWTGEAVRQGPYRLCFQVFRYQKGGVLAIPCRTSDRGS